MNASPSPLQADNFANLIWVREECRQSPANARSWFGFDAMAITFYAELDDGAAESLCRELDVALFIPTLQAEVLQSTLVRLAPAGFLPVESHLQLNNLRNLQSVRTACARSAAEAAWRYRLDHATAQAFAALSDAQSVGLAKALQGSFVGPRYSPADLRDILLRPSSTRGMYAAAIEVEILAANDDGRRGFRLTH
jgi:hypothetical protein